MTIEDLKQGQTVWVKGFVDSSVFGGCGGFINFYNQDGNHCGHISRNNVREMKEEDVQIDQPKPVVPKFVADWIEKYKEKRCRLYHVLEHVFDDVELSLYIKQQEGDYTEIIAKAWLYGYTVQKEKLYTVEIPNPNSAGGKTVLFKQKSTNSVIMAILDENINKPECLWLTEQEIRKDFDWAFRWAKEVE